MTNVFNANKTAVFSDSRLEQLAADDANRVYTYEYDTVERVLPMNEVRHKLLAIRGVTKGLLDKDAKVKWATVKQHLKENYPELWDMSRTHPKMFNVASHPCSSPEKDIAPMLFMVEQRALMEVGALSEKAAMQQVSSHLQDRFKLPKGKTKEDVTQWDVSTRPDAS